MTTIFCTPNYASKVLDMMAKGQAATINNLVLVGVKNIDRELKERADSQCITLRTFEQVMTVGKYNPN